MIISHKYKFIFIKTRKTAGSSVEKYLSSYLGPTDICTGSVADNTPQRNITDSDGHKNWRWVKEHYPVEWKTYYKFAVDRHPWDKMVSFYYYYKAHKPYKVSNGFNYFVQHRMQNDWAMYAEGSIIHVDKLVNYTILHEELRTMPIPYDDELLHIRVKADLRKNKEYKHMYNKTSLNMVNTNHAQLIKYFNYKY